MKLIIIEKALSKHNVFRFMVVEGNYNHLYARINKVTGRFVRYSIG